MIVFKNYFNIVKIGDIEDVMIMVYRKKDIDNSEQLPYIICSFPS